MIKHGVLWSWIFWNCCYVIGFIMCSEDGVNQGSGVVGGLVQNMLIFHCFISIMEQMLDHHGFCELDIIILFFIDFIMIMEQLEEAWVS